MSAADLTGGDAALASPATNARVGPGKLIGGTFRLLRSEIRIIVTRRRNIAGMAVLAAVPVILALAVYWSGDSSGGPDFIGSIAGNGLFVALAALSVEIGLFLPLAVATLSGDAIAGEANTGTLRYLLTVPVHRTRLLVVKYLSLVIGAFTGVAIVSLVGLAIGGLLFGFGSVTLLSGTQVPLSGGLLRLLLVVGYLTMCLASLAAVGLFISTLTEQPIGAMIAVTLFSTISWILEGIAQLSWLHPWLITHHWMAFADVMRDPILWNGMADGVLTATGYTAAFLSAAWASFAGRDVTS
ncbi:MAG: ABC transporter permease [Micrococcales bacterium]|nr:MAG: ABC transporter permease [Micrococcales bacterium]PIE26844.1 MAG: ABC transporter permease [Micrococcales bacterium]